MAVIVAGVLAALGGLVVVLTRLRLRHSHVGLPLTIHTWLGTAAVVLWLVFLAFPDDSVLGGPLVGVLALGCWWLVSLAGLAILGRWLPSRSRGKRAAATSAAADSWTGTPWLSVLGHGGMLLGVLWFTYAYVTSVV